MFTLYASVAIIRKVVEYSLLCMWAKSGSCFNFNRQGPYFEKMTMKGDRVLPRHKWVGEDGYDRRWFEERN